LRKALKSFLVLLPLIVILFLGCDGSREESITFVNETDHVVRVTEDGLDLTTLQPGESRAFGVRESLTPDRIQAFSDGRLVHDGMLLWDEVEADDFVYVIDVNVPSPTPAPPP